MDEGIRSEFIAIVNYGIVGLIQLELGYAESADITNAVSYTHLEMNLWSMAVKGGWIMIVLGLLSILCFYICLLYTSRCV